MTNERIINVILSSIAIEELGLAHILNSLGEEIQLAAGTLPDREAIASSLTELLEINKSAALTLRSIIKKEMLLQFKLEKAMTIPRTECDQSLQMAVFANNDFTTESFSLINKNVQVNGNLTLNHSGNYFLGNTNVVHTFSDAGGNIFENLVLNAPAVPLKQFDPACLMMTADEIIDGNILINKSEDAIIFQDKTVWVNGVVRINGHNITISGGGIFARAGIEISGKSFTYQSSGCFALYSQMGEIKVNNGPYQITGYVYAASPTAGNIRLLAREGGNVCGGVAANRDVVFSGGNAVHHITNQDLCSLCLNCNTFCSSK
ncbi:MAG: hypothetical protein PHT03_01485 [Bacilli bacterium]|nr:hypothetical protein [Bacilli bacterium]